MVTVQGVNGQAAQDGALKAENAQPSQAFGATRDWGADLPPVELNLGRELHSAP